MLPHFRIESSFNKYFQAHNLLSTQLHMEIVITEEVCIFFFVDVFFYKISVNW